MYTGDGFTPSLNPSYTQDFMALNSNLQTISTTYGGIYAAGYRGITFTLSRLKSDWNSYFTQLKSIIISDEHWNREDLSKLINLQHLEIYAGNQNHTNSSASNPPVPIPSSVIDNVLNQMAAGAGRTISNGAIGILTAGPNRTSASDAAVSFLTSKGWYILIDTSIR